MIIVSEGKTFLSRGAVVFEQKELDVMIKALSEERERVARSGGTRYGLLDMSEMSKMIDGFWLLKKPN